LAAGSSENFHNLTIALSGFSFCLLELSDN
jgi:hypothetical protein